jgi:DNA (cytosine-5)-methyltransferase 1
MENVAALVSQKFIGTFNQWQLELERYGYTNFSQVLNAKNYGVPQNRERIFMVSILNCDQAYYFPTPVELTKRLKDVLQENVDERYYLKEDALGNFLEFKNFISRGEQNDSYNRVWKTDGYCGALNCTKEMEILEPQVMTPKRTEYGKQIRKQYEAGEIEEQRKNIQQLEPRNDGVSNTLTSVQKDNYVLIPEATKDGYIPMEFGGVCDLSYPNSDTRRGRVQEGGTVAPTLTCGVENSLRRIEYGYRIRKLTERECFRLMDMPEEYIDRIQAAGISRSQQYKMAGNSIVVACMYHIWRKLFIDTEIKTLTLF